MKILYFDCFSGISGDMTVGALVDLGVDPQVIENELAKLHIQDEYNLKWEKVVKNGISSTKFVVELIEVDEEHHHHHHRHYKDIIELIKEANYNENITEMALSIFEHIGAAEAKIHNMPLEKVHFHEVGAIDSIIDIVATAIAIDHLGVDLIISSPVPVGNGKVHIDHGLYPIPAPATLEVLKGIPLLKSNNNGELTTPTGAGILKALVDSYGPFPSCTVESVGYGAGTKDFEQQPNVLRIVLATK